MIRAATDNQKTAAPSAPAPERLIITAAEIAAMTGWHRATVARLLNRLMADGLRRKGLGNGTCYDRGEFMAAWKRLDVRQ
jgi:DNA-binding IclR family transcriptional regulator